MIAPDAKRSSVERLKETSRRLRGALAEELVSVAPEVSEDSYNLLKFHGTYEQHDRDTATARKQAGLAKEYSFMVRVRMPGGRLNAAQYLALDALADRYANAGLRITTRQGIQFHGVAKGNLKAHIAEINRTLLTTQSACGDVARNLMVTPAPRQDAAHRRLLDDARMLAAALLPASRAYHQIFLDEADPGIEEEEALYGPAYLPRKFKIALALPEDNTVDVLCNDLGLIAVFEGGALAGYNIALGGGLGMTHNRADTYPRLASVLGFVPAAEALAVTRAAIGIHRDFGDRADRKRARLKYVLDDRGLDWTRAELAARLGHPLAAPRPTAPLAVPDLLGWHADGAGNFWLGIAIPSGRIADGAIAWCSALRAVIARFGCTPIMTPQQDILLADIAPADRAGIAALLAEYGIAAPAGTSALARWTLACPALPTCGLALTEAERVRDPIVAALEPVLAGLGLAEERISLRITGCPNGCARSYAGDIGLVGRIPGAYALYVGGDFAGTRLSFKLIERVRQDDLPSVLAPLFAAFAAGRAPGEGFGDFCHRLGGAALRALIEAARAPAHPAAAD
ncbi:MAG: NADPH-dependent assimilatory sulfite reductase hemoprotein subunit [Rhodospirillales bacterium]|nr:NADPH-dependent assimilatory sulfite reductase hemoprotein subunit [Rhodospirillales bacterium]